MAFAIAWSAVALVVLLGLAQFLVEWRGLRRIVRRADRPDRLAKAVAGLDRPAREVVTTFVDDVERSGVDEALTRALVQTAQIPFAPPPMVHTLAVAGTVVAVVGPAAAALLLTAEDLARTVLGSRLEPMRQRYLDGSAVLDDAFAALGHAFDGTGTVMAALALAWALRWWLLRPEVREARLCRALVICAGRIRPGASAPVGTRLVELIAPERGLTRPIVATGLWVVATTFGWLILLGTADLRTGSKPWVFDVWPQAARPFEPKNGVVLPRVAAGVPIERASRPSLTFAPTAVRFHDVALMTLTDGAPPNMWRVEAPEMTKSLADFPRPLEVVVLGHDDVPMATVSAILADLAVRYGIVRYHLVVTRDAGRQGAMKLTVDAKRPRGPTLRVQDSGVRVLPSRRFIAFGGGWRASLRKEVWATADVWGQTPKPAFALETGYPLTLTYGRFIEVLAAAESSCPTKNDCGLPGLGISFVLAP